jgi:MerR family mercuric resistance operon transcriptional regulator
MKKHTYSIGEMSKQTACKVETIHYYEKIKIMLQPARTPGGHRIYRISDVKRLNFIRKCRNLGFSIQQVRELLRFIDEPDHYCGEVKAMAMVQYRAVEDKIRELQQLQNALNSMITQCKNDSYSIDNCPIIDALFDAHS